MILRTLPVEGLEDVPPLHRPHAVALVAHINVGGSGDAYSDLAYAAGRTLNRTLQRMPVHTVAGRPALRIAGHEVQTFLFALGDENTSFPAYSEADWR